MGCWAFFPLPTPFLGGLYRKGKQGMGFGVFCTKKERWERWRWVNKRREGWAWCLPVRGITGYGGHEGMREGWYDREKRG